MNIDYCDSCGQMHFGRCPEPDFITVRICGDVEVGETVVKCECGEYRAAGAHHGYRRPTGPSPSNGDDHG